MKRIKSFINWMRLSRTRMVSGVIIVGLIIFILFKIFGGTSTQPQYQTAKVEKGTIVVSVSVSGQMLSANIINITTKASGVVKQVLVKDEDVVTSGQKIIETELDPQGEQSNALAWSNYLTAKTTLENANTAMFTLQSDMLTKWKTFKDLAESGQYQNSDGTPRQDARGLPQYVSVQDDWLAAEAKYKTQQNVISQSQAALNNAWLNYQATSKDITSSMNGTISNITVTPGTLIDGSATALRVAVIKNEGLPLATFNISEIDVSKITPGQKATITLDSLSGKTYTGKVMTVDRIGTVSSGVTNYPVIIQFDTQVPEVLPNMSTSASIILQTKDDVLQVPSTAVITSEGQYQVRILRNNSVEFVNVETGLTSDSQTEIVSGLNEGDMVITGTVATQTQTGRSVFGGGFGGSSNVRVIGR